jgi:predicted nucleic acid-binding protein
LTRYVLDASVAAKWFLPRADETLVDEALALLSDYAADRISLMAPDLLWPEFANILWKAVKHRGISTALAHEAIADLLALEIVSVSSPPLLGNAFTIAATFDRTVYDALYVAVAAENGAPMITADERLVNSLASRFPIHWLGAYASIS